MKKLKSLINQVILTYGIFLKNLIKQIPSNCIFFKKVPGIGATTLEIEDETRNSIIIEPNKPVIEGKCAKYNKSKPIRLMGVYENVTPDHIIEYLQSKVTPKKLMTTPESFYKIKDAMTDLKINMYEDYFLLFDECERTIQDVKFRDKITSPIDDFFKFKNKAFISATPIPPSDPRFVEQNFECIYLQPDYEYKENIELIGTNNVLFAIKKWITENPREQYFIFLNSVKAIAEVITHLNIKDDSAIFCAKERMQLLKVNNYKHVFSSLKAFRKYNFLTSRFFSAVDIENIPNPSILIVTNIVTAHYTMVDPYTTSIQIVGRFRKPEDQEINREIVHITNFEESLDPKTEQQVMEEVTIWQKVYSVINRFIRAATSIVARSVLREVSRRLEFSRLINPDGSRNYFIQDNMIYEERVKSYYLSLEKLTEAYMGSDYFIPKANRDIYEFTDHDNARILQMPSMKTVLEVVLPVIKDLHEPGKYDVIHVAFQMDYLSREFPDAVKAFNIIGLEKARELDFNYKKVLEAVRNRELELEKSNFGLIAYIEKGFKINEIYSSAEISSILNQAIKDNKLKLLKPNVQLLREYCKLSTRTWIGTGADGKNIMGYRIMEIYDKLKK